MSGRKKLGKKARKASVVKSKRKKLEPLVACYDPWCEQCTGLAPTPFAGRE